MLRNSEDKTSTTDLNELSASTSEALLSAPITEKVVSKALLTIRQEQIIHRRFDQLVNMSQEVLQSVIAESPRDIAEIVGKKIIQDHDHYSEHFRRLKQVITKIQALSPDNYHVFMEALRTVITQEQVDHAFDKYRSSGDPLTNMLMTYDVSSENLLSAIKSHVIEQSVPYFKALLEKNSDFESIKKAVKIFFSKNSYEEIKITDVKSLMVDLLIEKMPGNTDILGCALLHVVSHGDKHFKQDVVKKLIDAHASLAWTLNSNHHTALHCAVNFKNFDDNDLVILEMLLKAGFDATVRESAANLAQQNKHSYVSALILNYDDNNIRNRLLNYTGTYELYTLNKIYHILRNEEAMLQDILKEENRTKRTTKFKESVLTLAKKNNFKTAMELIVEDSCLSLIERQSSYIYYYYAIYKSFQDKDGNTLLHYAALHGNVDAIKKLLGEGFNWSIVNNQGKTPAKLALENGYIDAARNLGESSLNWQRSHEHHNVAMIQVVHMAVAGHVPQIEQMAHYYVSSWWDYDYGNAMIFHCLAAVYSANQDEKLSYKNYIEKLDINGLFFLFNGSKKRFELQLLKNFLLNHCLQANTLSQLIEKHPDIEPLALMLFIMKNTTAGIDHQKEAQITLEDSIKSMMKKQMYLYEDEIHKEMMRIQRVIEKIQIVPTCDEQKLDSTSIRIQPEEKADIQVALPVSPVVPSSPPLLIQHQNTAASRYSGTLFAGNELTTKFIPGVAADLRALEDKERRFTQH